MWDDDDDEYFVYGRLPRHEFSKFSNDNAQNIHNNLAKFYKLEF